ncbi:MAG: GAF domain-containing protein, partial [Candidatus Hodarchaeales archaeon]
IHIDKINENARHELEFIGFKDYPSLLSIPLTEDENSFGMLMFGSKQINRHWSENTILFLRMVGEMISRALLKKRLENEILSQEKEMRRYLSSLQNENENLMNYLLEINNKIKEYLEKDFEFRKIDISDTVDLNNIIKKLEKEFVEIKINTHDLPIVYGNYEIIYLCFKLLFENAVSFKESITINLNWNAITESNELRISSNSFSIFYDIPSALSDISSTSQYKLLLNLKNLLTINSWKLEISERPEIVLVIKNIKPITKNG